MTFDLITMGRAGALPAREELEPLVEEVTA